MKIIPKFFCLLILGFIAFPALAQHTPCGTDEATEKMHNQYPGLKQQQDALEDKIYEISQEPSPLSKKGTVYIIPVVFHVIHQYGNERVSKDLIDASMAQLNADFRGSNPDTSGVHSRWKNNIADMEIEFRLATKDPNGNCTQGIVYVESAATNEPKSGEVQQLSRWNPQRYMNVYVVRDIFTQDGFTTAGYAYLPPAAPELDGIVIDYNFLGSGRRTLTHEAGHYLALLHPFQGGCGNSGANCNLQGDRVCDTPPTKERNFGCNQTQNTCSTDSPDLPDQVENHMDYSTCSRMFTEGQKTRARSAITSYRSTLVSTSNNSFTGTDHTNQVNCKPIADFHTTANFACGSQPVRFTNYSYNGSTPIIKWYFPGGTPSTSTDNNPQVSYNSPGTYGVKLVVTNSNGSDSITKTSYIEVLPREGQHVAPFSEDFENINLSQEGWETRSTHNSIKWQVTGQAGASGNSSIYINNNNVFSSGELFTLIMPSVDLRDITEPVLKFKVAYAKKSSSSSDILRVFASTSCGQSYVIRFIATATTLAGSTPIVTGNFVPTASDWKEHEISLANFANDPGIVLKFEFVSGVGNNIYFDDIQVTGKNIVGIDDKDPVESSFRVYPNPASTKEKFYLEFTSAVNNMLSLQVYDFTGKQVAVKEGLQVLQGMNKLELDAQSLNISTPGIYILKARIDGAVIVRKLTVFNN